MITRVWAQVACIDRAWTDAEDRREDELSGLAKGGDSMHATGITANLSVADLAEARDF
jgi:hypothetical protein